jgi:hypothetical protein
MQNETYQAGFMPGKGEQKKMKNHEEILVRQLAIIGHQNLPELKQKFEELHGFKPGNTTPRNLRKRIASRLQEIYFGGLSDEDMETLNAIADKDKLANLDQSGIPKVINREGTRFKRVWKGTEYEVLAIGDGTFEFNNKKYKSLSSIAREITGTRWNGKLFFGVKKNG